MSLSFFLKKKGFTPLHIKMFLERIARLDVGYDTMCLAILTTFLRSSSNVRVKRVRHSLLHPRVKRVGLIAIVTILLLTVNLVLVFFGVNSSARISGPKYDSSSSSSPWVSAYADVDASFNSRIWVPAEQVEKWQHQTLSRLSLNNSSTPFPSFSQLLNQSSSVPPENTHLRAKACVFYDAPPRTGAEVIAPALHACLRSKGFQTLRADADGSPSQSETHDAASSRDETRFATLTSLLVSARQMLAPPAKGVGRENVRIASVSASLVFSAEDLPVVADVCESALYVSSARPMAHRLADALWHDVRAQRSENDPLALSVAAAVDPAAVARLERAYAAFPWIARNASAPSHLAHLSPRNSVRRIGGDEHAAQPLHDPAHLPCPDYVITEADFAGHLTLLLEAFGCRADAGAAASKMSVASFFPWLSVSKSYPSLTDPFYVPRRVSGRDVVIDRVATLLQSHDASFKMLSTIAQHANIVYGLPLARRT